MGQKETAVTATGKNRIMIYGPKNVARTSSSLRASLVASPSTFVGGFLSSNRERRWSS
jgi:hypothetical protein